MKFFSRHRYSCSNELRHKHRWKWSALTCRWVRENECLVMIVLLFLFCMLITSIEKGCSQWVDEWRYILGIDSTIGGH